MIVGCCLLMFAGCKKADIVGKNTIGRPERFPKVMVGMWETTGSLSWVFEFQPDGSILKMWHFMAGRANLTTEGETHIETDKPPTRMEYFLAPCKAKYDPATQEVSIEVVMDYYKIQTRDKVLEGSGADIFRGPLSKDGKTWNAEWLNYLEIEGKKLNRDAVKPRHLVFTKVDAR